MTRSTIQWIGPAPPLRTGIAGYSKDFFRAVDGLWDIDMVLEKGSEPGEYQSIRPSGQPDPDLPTIIHLGNSEHHSLAYEAAHNQPGVLVLHDVVLHHARAARMLRLGRGREYWRELQSEYGAAGVDTGRKLLAGEDVPDLEAFPMCERFVRKSLVTVVHSQYAADSIQRRVPEANVRVVPMGIPIPAQIAKRESRRALGISEGSYVVASITHVNPNKRLPVVLRAMRRLIAREPDVLLVMAGTGTDSEMLTREIRMMGLQQHVLQLGYVDDMTARLVAAAADACVNLRYPTTGETSASLLRLLGAGLPVLVSAAGTSLELPDGVGLKIPVDEFEVEMVTEVLWELANNSSFRADAGNAAREFAVTRHSMVNEVDGFRSVLADTYGVELPGLDDVPFEQAPVLGIDTGYARRPGVISLVADAISELGIDDQDAAINLTGSVIADLRLEGYDARGPVRPRERLLERVACMACGAKLGQDGACRECGHQLVTRGPIVDLR